jgi:TIR domain
MMSREASAARTAAQAPTSSASVESGRSIIWHKGPWPKGSADGAVQMYSCFISYSNKDHDLAERLQDKGVRCWFASHDLPIGAKTWDAIDEEIKLRDKLLLILSENSIASDWVEDEVNKAFAEERDRKRLVLFPVRIDDAVMASSEPWARKLRDQRNRGRQSAASPP